MQGVDDVEKSGLPSGYLGAGSHLPPNRKCLGAWSASGAPGGFPMLTRHPQAHTLRPSTVNLRDKASFCGLPAARGLHWGNLVSADKKGKGLSGCFTFKTKKTKTNATTTTNHTHSGVVFCGKS